LKHIYAQIIDDAKGRTMASASSREKGQSGGGKKEGAAEVGKLIAARCREKGIDSVVFDRGGFKYHGRVKALADAAREAGLKF
jgi:large subunit ribosomal protein L18